ncbi:MAG TPA: hypothetical protein VGC55_06350 [Dokdonella sp.]
MHRISKSGGVRSGILAVVLLALGGCVYGPDYGYVRGDGYSGDAYYGTQYYGGSGYYDNDPWGYYGYGPGIGLGFYYDDYHHRHYYHGPHGGWGGGGNWHGGDNYGHGGYYGHSGHAMPSRAGGGAHSSAPPAHASSRGSH